MDPIKCEIKQEVTEENTLWKTYYISKVVTLDSGEAESTIVKKELGNNSCTRNKIFSPQCRACEEKFSTVEDLNEHYKNNKNHNIKRFMCTKCHKSFDMLKELLDHKLNVHDESNKRAPMRRIHKCNICGKAFAYERNLKLHVLTHGGQKPFLCEQCGAAFATDRDLTTHKRMRKNHNLKLKNNEQSKMDPLMYNQQHTFVCTFCDHRFPFKFILKSHIKVHKELRYECPLCRRSYSSERSLRIHRCLTTCSNPDLAPKLEYYIEREVSNYSEDEFSNYFRMNRASFNHVLLLIKNKICVNGYSTNRSTISGEFQLQMALWHFGSPDHFRVIFDYFSASQCTIIRSIRCVVEALFDLAPFIIKWPDKESLERIKDSCMGLPTTIGSIGTTNVHTHVSKENPKIYTCKHNYPSITLQAVCDDTLKFTHCFAKEMSSASAIKAFIQRDLLALIDNRTYEMFPGNSHLVSNLQYPCLPKLVTPYNDGTLTNKQINFNRLLLHDQNAIERAFNLLRSRFRCLKSPLDTRSKSLKWAAKYVIACCVLHNICLMQNDLIEVDNLKDADNCNVGLDFENVDQARIDLGVEKRNDICEGILFNL